MTDGLEPFALALREALAAVDPLGALHAAGSPTASRSYRQVWKRWR